MADVHGTVPKVVFLEEEDHIHMPDPSIWPLILAAGVGLLPLAGLILFHPEILPGGMQAAAQSVGWALLGLGGVLTGVSAVGWAASVIKEKLGIDIAWGNQTLSMAWKLFLISEAAIFGSFFAHYFYVIWQYDNAGLSWPPAGTPHIHLLIPALGTIVLVISSFTCEFGHKALLAGNRALCKNWLMLTLVLGLAFLALQGYEWGYLMNKYGFLPDTSVFSTQFYLITGFHGAHVITGLLLLFLVYARLELGSFDRKRHFSLNAASWYWHFVDVIWIGVFFCVYIGIQGGIE